MLFRSREDISSGEIEVDLICPLDASRQSNVTAPPEGIRRTGGILTFHSNYSEFRE